MKEQILHNKSGFTLIEMLVAVSILLVGISPILFILGNGIAVATSAKSRLTATFLAQEGVELVRRQVLSNYIKINNPLSGDNGISWTKGFDGTDGTADCMAKYCTIAPFAKNFSQCMVGSGTNPSDCLFLQQNSVNHKYGYGLGPGTNTIFKRAIRVDINNDHPTEKILEISVVVEWRDKNSPRSLTLTEVLYRWGPGP